MVLLAVVIIPLESLVEYTFFFRHAHTQSPGTVAIESHTCACVHPPTYVDAGQVSRWKPSCIYCMVRTCHNHKDLTHVVPHGLILKKCRVTLVWPDVRIA